MFIDILPIVINHWIRPINTIHRERFFNRLETLYTQRTLLMNFRKKKKELFRFYDVFGDSAVMNANEEERHLLQELRDISRDLVIANATYKTCPRCRSHIIRAETYGVDEENTFVAEFMCRSHTCGNGYVLVIEQDDEGFVLIDTYTQ
jgi:hypothetical protein